MQDLKTMLDELGIPVAYSHFNTTMNPPLVVYHRDTSSNFGADGKVYKKINNYLVELYTAYKDTTMEEQLEQIFDNHDAFYNVESEDYIDTEQMYQIIYRVNIEET